MGKIFDKYDKFAPDYHYRQIDRSSLKRYNAFVDARYKKAIDTAESVIRKSIVIGKKVRILDVGCGDGVALKLIREKLTDMDLELHGADQSQVALEIAEEKNPGAVFKKTLADDLPYDNDYFDFIISSDVIEHVENPEKMLAEMKRVAKSGAYVLIGTPIRVTKYPADHNHIQEFFVEDFMELLSNYFRDNQLYESHNIIFTLLYGSPTRSFINFKYLINLLSLVFNYNLFLKERTNKHQMFSYMFIIGRK